MARIVLGARELLTAREPPPAPAGKETHHICCALILGNGSASAY